MEMSNTVFIIDENPSFSKIYNLSVGKKKANESSINPRTRQIYYALVASLGFFFGGINRAFLAFLFYHIESSSPIVKLHTVEESWFALGNCLLNPIGSMLAGFCMDFMGRRRTLQLIYFPIILAWSIIAFSTNITTLFITFLIQGISVGMSYCVVVYLAEIATPTYRGALFTIPQVSYNIGILFNNYIMYFLSLRVISIMYIVMSIGALILNNFIPESPVWMHSKGESQKSVDILCSLRRSTEDQLFEEIQDMENYCPQKKFCFKDIIPNCINAWRQLAVVILLSLLSINCGYVLVEMFILTIFKRLRVPCESRELALTYLFIGVLTSFMMPYFVHKAKRKTVLSLASFGMCSSMIAIALFEEFNNVLNPWIISGGFCMYCFCANIGLVPIGLLISGEILPHESKGVLTGICGTVEYLYLIIIQQIFPFYLERCGAESVIWTFATCGFITTLFAIYYLPETKEKTLYQIQDYFRKKTMDGA